MRVIGRLDYAYWIWHLVLEDDEHPVRYWSDKDSAIAELTDEGWLLLGPFPRRYRGAGSLIGRTTSLDSLNERGRDRTNSLK